ncbi:MAG: cell division protein FtsL [Proteobacteria bacterium]|nr:MAG: cell division protein FtsL [Pseudomonadota bacterium]
MFFIDAGMARVFARQQVAANNKGESFSLKQVFSVFNKNTMITLGLMSVLSVCIFSAVYAVHVNRDLYSRLEMIQNKRDFYQAQWSQLLLEQSALTAQGRVEKIARDDLDMVIPRTEEIIQIRQ